MNTVQTKPVVITRKRNGKGGVPASALQVSIAAVPQPVEPPDPHKQEQELHARRALLETIQDRWPHAFPREKSEFKPWAIGVHRDMIAALSGHPTRRIRAVIAFYQRWVKKPYLQALVRGGPRYDLDGNPRGEVTADESARAREDLKKFYAQKKRFRAPAPQGTEEKAGETA